MHYFKMPICELVKKDEKLSSSFNHFEVSQLKEHAGSKLLSILWSEVGFSGLYRHLNGAEK